MWVFDFQWYENFILIPCDAILLFCKVEFGHLEFRNDCCILEIIKNVPCLRTGIKKNKMQSCIGSSYLLVFNSVANIKFAKSIPRINWEILNFFICPPQLLQRDQKK